MIMQFFASFRFVGIATVELIILNRTQMRVHSVYTQKLQLYMFLVLFKNYAIHYFCFLQGKQNNNPSNCM